jgi:hypothetical protein
MHVSRAFLVTCDTHTRMVWMKPGKSCYIAGTQH